MQYGTITPDMARIEAERHEPVATVLVKTINRHRGSFMATGKELGVSTSTVLGWCYRFGIKMERVLLNQGDYIEITDKDGYTRRLD